MEGAVRAVQCGPPSRRQIAATEPRLGYERSELVVEGFCPACETALVRRYMENEQLDGGPRNGQCDCCGWWWRAGDGWVDLVTLGRDPRCGHVKAIWA